MLEADYSKTETSLDSVRKDFYNTFRLDIMVSVCVFAHVYVCECKWLSACVCGRMSDGVSFFDV